MRRRLALFAAPVLAGAVLAGLVDAGAPPFSGRERLSAVYLLDGTTYFGHLVDLPWSDSIELHEVYYFQAARESGVGLPVQLVRRGTEVHQPIDGMRIRRDKVLAVERVGFDSAVTRAIQADRAFTAGAAR